MVSSNTIGIINYLSGVSKPLFDQTRGTFGSAIYIQSDVDIAAWGIDSEDTFRAIGAVMALGKDIEFKLVI
ncbi:hypothetical protein SSCH_780005 [Syntrophaceticus schinkii]|uniref:Uncharacterized protein n=1 Tax=Syntrophaceticus schinkii TaxID=499207 RepID=A0A0B7MQ25_9FIRM|nr:hypothetical protein SSCH_780005 [Syntrophaceticus schinkii]